MEKIEDFNEWGEEIESLMLLRTSPIAVKLLEKEDDIPEGTIRPKRDLGVHLSLCQAFAMSRRNKETVAMLKEDNWCWTPPISFGMVEPPDLLLEGNIHYPNLISDKDAAKRVGRDLPRLEFGKYIGLISAPLRTAGFKPDLVLIYSNPAQLRHLLLGMQYKDGYHVHSEFNPIDSCVYSTIPAILTGECRITLPDPGEYERALAGEDEIIFSIPRQKLGDLLVGLRHTSGNINLGYKNLRMQMLPDFPRPDFYKKLFRSWGMDDEP